MRKIPQLVNPNDLVPIVRLLIPEFNNLAGRVSVGVAGGSTIGPFNRINFIAGANVTITATGDNTNDEIDLTIAATGGGGGGGGDFVGPASATDNAVVLFDGTTGKLGKNSVVTIVAGAMAGVTSLVMAGALSGVTTIATSGAINGQTISASAAFTGTVSVSTSLTTPLITRAGGISIFTTGANTIIFSTDSVLRMTVGATGIIAIAGAATIGTTLGVTGISTFTGGITMPTGSILAQLADNTRVGNTSTPIFFISGFNAAESRMFASNITSGRRNFGWLLNSTGLQLQAFNDAASLTDVFLTINQGLYNGVHTITFGGGSGSRAVFQSENVATPAQAPLSIPTRTNAPATLVNGDFFTTPTDAFVRLGGVSRSLTSSTPAWAAELVEIVWGTPGAESADSIDVSASSFDLDAGAISSDEIAVMIVVSDAANDSEPSATATLSAASTPVGTVLGGSGTGTLIMKANSSGNFAIKCSETAAGNRFIWVKAGGHFQRFVKARDGLLQLTFA